MNSAVPTEFNDGGVGAQLHYLTLPSFLLEPERSNTPFKAAWISKLHVKRVQILPTGKNTAPDFYGFLGIPRAGGLDSPLPMPQSPHLPPSRFRRFNCKAELTHLSLNRL